MLLEEPQHAIAHVRWIVVRDDGMSAAFGKRHLLAAGKRVIGRDEHHELVVPEDNGAQSWFGRLEGQYPEVQCPLRHLGPNLPRGYAPYVHMHQRMRLAEPGDERQHDVNRGFVGADEDAAAPQV